MKTLSLARPLILLLVGLPGAGKSFFGRQFSEMFNAPIVSFDRLRYEIFAQPKRNSDEQDLLQRVVDYQVAELIKTHRSFVVDGGCNSRVERQKLEQLAKAHGYGTLTVWVQTDESTCKSRATHRNPKRIDDKMAGSINDSQWTDFAKRFTPPTREPYMVISGKHAFSTQAKMVLRKLSTPHTEQAEAAHQQETQQALHQPAKTPTLTIRQNGRPPRRNVLIS